MGNELILDDAASIFRRILCIKNKNKRKQTSVTVFTVGGIIRVLEGWLGKFKENEYSFLRFCVLEFLFSLYSDMLN